MNIVPAVYRSGSVTGIFISMQCWNMVGVSLLSVGLVRIARYKRPVTRIARHRQQVSNPDCQVRATVSNPDWQTQATVRRCNMIIKGCKTIKEYKALREHFVGLWYQTNFDSGTTYYDIVGNYVKVVDYTGDSVKVPLSEIPGYH